MKKIIITRKDGVITNIVNTSEVVSNGLLVEDETEKFIIANIQDYNVYEDVETADTIAREKYIYTTEGGFTVNPNYVVPEADAIKTRLALLEKAMADLIMNGGAI